MRKHTVLLFLFFLHALLLCAQTPADSAAIVAASWEESIVRGGLVLRQVSVPGLYGDVQHISVMEVDPDSGLRIGIASALPNEKTSGIAARNNAISAVNGSYFDMKRGNSACFLKVNAQVTDTTVTGNFGYCITGAVRVHKGKIELMRWDTETEKSYRKRKGAVLASGPLLLKDGKLCGWCDCSTEFSETKHPRTAVCVTREGKVLLVTVDGRFTGKARGVSLSELAHLLRVLGAQDALNLDGGGSTTMWCAGAPDNGVVNHPCDNGVFDHKGERHVANILYVFSTKN